MEPLLECPIRRLSTGVNGTTGGSHIRFPGARLRHRGAPANCLSSALELGDLPQVAEANTPRLMDVARGTLQLGWVRALDGHSACPIRVLGAVGGR
jgi:hypothetical protein